MVATYANARTLAHQLFEEEWRRLDRAADDAPESPPEAQPQITSASAAPSAATSTLGTAWPHWLLPELVRLLDEAPDRSVADLEPVIRELVIEQRFIEDAGDPAIAPEHDGDAEVDAQVRVFIRVLERLRANSPHTGAWADVPTPPQMFG